MRIVVNALSSRVGGGRTYLQNLLVHDVPLHGTEVRVIMPASAVPAELGKGVSPLAVDDRLVVPPARLAWERFALPGVVERLRADVLFCPGGTLPPRGRGGALAVTMSRNMLPFDGAQHLYRLGYTRVRLRTLRRLLLRSMVAADLVIFVSNHARAVVQQAAGGPVQRSTVISHGVGKEFSCPPATALPEWCSGRPYILYVSNVEPYKCQRELVRAFALMKRARPGPEKLVFVGPESCKWYARRVRAEIADHGLGADVMLVGSLSHAELPGIYMQAKMAMFASLCENCPNVLLEGMAAGTPMVVSNRAPMPEFGGDAVLYADPADPASTAAQMVRLLDDEKLRDELSRRCLARAATYDWRLTAEKTWLAIAGLPGLEER